MAEFTGSGLPVTRTGREFALKLLYSDNCILRNPTNVDYSYTTTAPAYDFPCQFSATEPSTQYTSIVPRDAKYAQIRVPKGCAVWVSLAGGAQGINEYNINARWPDGLAVPPNTPSNSAVMYIDCYSREYYDVKDVNLITVQSATGKSWVNICYWGEA